MENKLSRRKVISTFSLTGLGLLATGAKGADSNFNQPKEGGELQFYSTAAELKLSSSLKVGMMVQTAGYYAMGDGGHASYFIKNADPSHGPDNGSILLLKKGLHAALINVSSVNYKLFGVVGDQINDDGIQIKAAHHYANSLKIPVINLSGEYWFGETNDIEIKTNTDWGQSIFHFNEKYNSRESRFNIVSNFPPVNIVLSETEKASLISQLKPGVQVIPELAPYKNSFIIIADINDSIGLRNQSTGISKGWAREEMFYVEEHGRIIGDLAWTFKDYTSLTAFPANDSYLTVNGGTFYLSGDNEGTYFSNGIRIQRSRTIVANQWVGLEPGMQDVAKIQRSGFYNLNSVFDVTLENIRLIPWEKDRIGVPMVPQGTYGISGNRWMKVTFKNITAEGSPIHWGVFGTNLTKDFRIENCVLNRVDVHFHCWNLYIKDSKIGLRGLTLTGGGDLFIENTTVSNNSFISFRADYGAKWDGDIRIRNCRLSPRLNAQQVSVLQFSTADFDFKYPIGYGRTLRVEDMVIDFTGDPHNKAVCWLMRTSEWLNNADEVSLFFPELIEFRNVSIRGREQGLRLLKLYDCAKYHMPKAGAYDGVRLLSNCRILFQNIDLEKMAANTGTDERLHFYMNDSSIQNNPGTLYPEIKFEGCKNLNAYVGKGTANLKFEDCSISSISKNEGSFKGRLFFSNCEFEPLIDDARQVFYSLEAELGVSFTNCILYAPRIKGQKAVAEFDRNGFVQINRTVRFNHLNTRLGNDIIQSYKTGKINLSAQFIDMLKSHHELEPEI